MMSLLLPSGSNLLDILKSIDTKITKLNSRIVKNLPFEDETSIEVIHNKGYYPIIQMKTLDSADWSVVHNSVNKFTVSFPVSSTDVLIYF